MGSFVWIGLIWVILFFEVGAIALEGESKLSDEFLHVVADGKAFFVGFCG